MSLFRSSTDNHSGATFSNTNVGTSSSSSALTSTPPLHQNDNSTSLITHIGDDAETPISLPIHTLSRPSDWVRLLHSILFTRGQNSILACLSFLYIIARLPLAVWSIYQINRFAIGSTAKGIAFMIVVFLMWILEKEIGLEKRSWDMLVGMGRVWIVEERGRRERDMERLRGWDERQRFERKQRERRERDERDWNGKDEDSEDVSLDALMGEACTLRDDDRFFYEESDTTKLL